MVALRKMALALGFVLVAGCGGAQRAPEPARARFVITPESARVYSDERFLGTGRVLDARPFQTRPGVRRFSITADGYFPHDLEVDLPSGTTTIELRLRPVPP